MARGHAAFTARVALADAAERTLDLQYYSADDDLSTDLLLLRLHAAAERGVRVRILLDDIYAPSRRFAQRALALHPGIQVRLFNPFFCGGTTGLCRLVEHVFDSERLNRRMHNKLWVTDNAVAIVGSRTRSELLILSPYFIPSSEGRRHLRAMRERGVRVAVLTDSLAPTDSPATHSGYARHRVELLRGGVELYEVRPIPGVRHRVSHRWGEASPSSLHAKLIVQDRSRAIVGSLNQDPRSRLHNTEAWIAVDSVEIGADLAALFEAAADAQHAFKLELDAAGGSDHIAWSTEEGAATVRYDVEPVAVPWLRLWRGILGAFVPEHIL